VKIISLIVLLLSTTAIQAARTLYVTDNLEILLRSGQGTEFKIIASIETGTPLTLIKTHKASGWTKVRTKDGQTGWVLARFLTDTPVASVRLKSANDELEKLREENKRLSMELDGVKSSVDQAVTAKNKLSSEHENLSQKLARIKHASENSIQILDERDQLQERVVNLERSSQKLKREKQALEDSSSQDWFLTGAAVLFFGALLGLILPRISWRRKSSSWDSF